MNTALKKINQLQYNTQLNQAKAAHDLVIVEEPLLISLNYYDKSAQLMKNANLTVVMRTPGNDQELVMGLLFNEGVIKSASDIDILNVLEDEETQNHIEVTLANHIVIPWDKISRQLTSYSSCGICGKSSLKTLLLKSNQTIDTTSEWLTQANILELVNSLKAHQPLFESTGAVHGAGYVLNNQWISVHEDVGRHNAVDKVIGGVLLQQNFHQKSILVLSGRVSFELMQKAIMAGISTVVAVGAPSNLAISAAQQFNITLVGFTKAHQFNVYSGDHRICK